MNKNTLNETKKESNESTIRGLSNAEMACMYNMPAMTSGPSDATLEERRQLDSKTSAEKHITND
jgi:hypothetical protein